MLCTGQLKTLFCSGILFLGTRAHCSFSIHTLIRQIIWPFNGFLFCPFFFFLACLLSTVCHLIPLPTSGYLRSSVLIMPLRIQEARYGSPSFPLLPFRVRALMHLSPCQICTNFSTVGIMRECSMPARALTSTEPTVLEHCYS